MVIKGSVIMSKTAYQLTKEWNKAIGNPTVAKLALNHPYTILCANLIAEEQNELVEALEKRDRKEVIDALGDITVCVNNMLMALGVDGDDLNQEIFDSNLSKLCYNEEDIAASIKFYDEKGVKSHSIEVEKGVWVIKNTETGKTLKGIHFKTPNLDRFR
jgi:phosphoribosyl-ATP pyrophosphohydrolase